MSDEPDTNADESSAIAAILGSLRNSCIAFVLGRIRPDNSGLAVVVAMEV